MHNQILCNQCKEFYLFAFLVPILNEVFKTKTNFFSELAQLSGIAAILRFPMPELEDEDEIEDDNDTQDSDSDN